MFLQILKQLHVSDLATERGLQLMTKKCAERTEPFFQFPILCSAIGYAGLEICACRCNCRGVVSLHVINYLIYSVLVPLPRHQPNYSPLTAKEDLILKLPRLQLPCGLALTILLKHPRYFFFFFQLRRGALKYNIKAFSLAVKDLTEAVAIDCKCSLAYFNRAVCYHEMKFFQKVCETH